MKPNWFFAFDFRFDAKQLAVELGRYLALAQQLKDSITIVCMHLLLLFPVAWPGLVLYSLRWRLLRHGASPTRSVVLWTLTLAHEVFCIWLFTGNELDPDLGNLPPYQYGYMLGAALSFAALVSFMLHSAPVAHPADAD